MSYFYAPPPPPPTNNYGTAPTPTLKHDSDEEDEEVLLAKKLAANGPVPIQGTSLVLVTPEDIENWRAERRLNWPTSKRVLERQQLEQEHKQKKQKTNAPAQPRKCTFFAKSGKCKFGDKCRFSHEKSTGTKTAASAEPTSKVYKRYQAPKKMPLYKKLFRTDVMQENETLLAFIKHLNERGLLD